MSSVGGVSADFDRFWLGQTLSVFGGRIGGLALSVTAVEILGASSGEVGILTAASTAAALILGLPAGAWVDRMRKRNLMVLCSSVRTVLMLALPVLWWSGHLQIEALYVVAAGVGIAALFFDIAYLSYIPLLVPANRIATANSRLEASAQVAILGGPGLAGLLLRWLSAPVVLLADAASYLVSVIALLTIEDREARAPRRDGARPRLGADIASGVRFVVREPVMRRLALSVGVSNFFATIVTTLIPILVLRVLGFDGLMLGVIMMSGAAGGVFGALLVPSLQRRFRDGRVMAGGLLLAAGCSAFGPLAALNGSHGSAVTATLLLVGEFGTGLGAVSFRVPQMSVRQRRCPQEMQGRMNATLRYVVRATMPFAALAAGWMGAELGVVPALWIGVAGAVVTVLPIFGIDRLLSAAGETVEPGKAFA